MKYIILTLTLILILSFGSSSLLTKKLFNQTQSLKPGDKMPFEIFLKLHSEYFTATQKRSNIIVVEI